MPMLLVLVFIFVIIIGIGWSLYLHYEVESLTDNSKETAIEDFLEICQKTLGGRGRPSYAMTQDVEGKTIATDQKVGSANPSRRAKKSTSPVRVGCSF